MSSAQHRVDPHLIAIYARDHHALLIVLRELAARPGGIRSAAHRAFVDEVRRAAEDDRASLETFLAGLGRAPSRLRSRAVWAAEKLGRLKLNGRLVKPSPLSAVVELEGCRLLLDSNRALWSALAHLDIGPADAPERAERARTLCETAERLRLDALGGLGPSSPG